MKVLITGGSGMVGRNLIEFLEKKEGFEIFAPTRGELDLLDQIQVRDYVLRLRPEIIVHCAGIVGGIQANISNPYSFLSLNLQIGLNIINAAIQARVDKFLNLGSSCMYPKDYEGNLEEEMILTGPLEPTNEGYAISKIAIAKLCTYAEKEYGLYYKTLIPCNLYGKYDKFDPHEAHMIPAVIRKLHEAKRDHSKAVIWGDGTARREFMYVEDLADFIHFSIFNYDKLEATTNVGLGYDYTIFEYYKAVAGVIGFNGEFDFDLSKPQGMKRKLCSISKQTALGWKPKHSLQEGLVKTNNYFLKSVWNIN